MSFGVQTKISKNKKEVFFERSNRKMKIRPLADKVLVRRLEAETTTSGGIVLPDSAKEKPQRGKIVSVGDGKVLDDGTVRKLQVKKGDMVLFTSYAGTEVKIDGKEYLIMSESDIMAVIEKKKKKSD
jgi:chaperonin GroES